MLFRSGHLGAPGLRGLSLVTPESAAHSGCGGWLLIRILDDLKVPPGNGLEALKDDRKGQHSIRINQQWRVCFVWTSEGATNVEIVDYH